MVLGTAQGTGTGLATDVLSDLGGVSEGVGVGTQGSENIKTIVTATKSFMDAIKDGDKAAANLEKIAKALDSIGKKQLPEEDSLDEMFKFFGGN